MAVDGKNTQQGDIIAVAADFGHNRLGGIVENE
jgi:hypothetical protein